MKDATQHTYTIYSEFDGSKIDFGRHEVENLFDYKINQKGTKTEICASKITLIDETSHKSCFEV